MSKFNYRFWFTSLPLGFMIAYVLLYGIVGFLVFLFKHL